MIDDGAISVGAALTILRRWDVVLAPRSLPLLR